MHPSYQVIGASMLAAGIVLLVGFLWFISQFGDKPKSKRQQWASRSPEKLNDSERRFCLLVARGVAPADAIDGIIAKDFLATSGHPGIRAIAAKWMKKPKIQAEIARVKWRATCAIPDDTPTADLTEEVGTQTKPAEPWEGL